MKGINKEIKVFSVISDLASEYESRDKGEESSKKIAEESLELRIQKLEKLVAKLSNKSK